jgi:hypothetical protein
MPRSRRKRQSLVPFVGRHCLSRPDLDTYRRDLRTGISKPELLARNVANVRFIWFMHGCVSRPQGEPMELACYPIPCAHTQVSYRR